MADETPEPIPATYILDPMPPLLLEVCRNGGVAIVELTLADLAPSLDYAYELKHEDTPIAGSENKVISVNSEMGVIAVGDALRRKFGEIEEWTLKGRRSPSNVAAYMDDLVALSRRHRLCLTFDPSTGVPVVGFWDEDASEDYLRGARDEAS